MRRRSAPRMEDGVSAGSGNGADIDTEAAAWAVRSAERPLDSSEQQQLDAWLEADSRHLGAYVRAQALWLDLDRVAALDSGNQRDYSGPARSRPWRRYAMAASVAVALFSGAI